MRVVLLVGGMRKAEREEALAEIARGEADLVVGTHALLQEDVVFDRLSLVVVDEQHKFGVAQRAALRGKGHDPDVLVMTATPIPRTLGLTVYGELDVSILDELPPGRGRIQTFVRSADRLPKVWEFVRSQLQAGRQAYVVYPRVEETDGKPLFFGEKRSFVTVVAHRHDDLEEGPVGVPRPAVRRGLGAGRAAAGRLLAPP